MTTGWQKSQKMGNQTSLDHLDDLQNIGHETLDITGEKIHWIKYRTSFNKKMKKKKKTLVKVEDFKVHHCDNALRDRIRNEDIHNIG